MRIPGRRRLQGFARWLRSWFVNGALILGYHRVARVAQDPFGLCVSPEHLHEHLEALCQYAHPVRLQMVADGLPDEGWPRCSVVLTFDDGYADLLEIEPLLARYQVPATVFVTTDSMGNEFWWDELERIVLSSDRIHRSLSLRMDESIRVWEPEKGELSEQVGWGPEGRLHLLHTLYRLLVPLDPVKRQQAMDQLRDWAGKESNGRPTARALTEAELAELARGGLIEVGAHAVTHSSLADLAVPRQREEIRASKVRLEVLSGRPVAAFSYPNGSLSTETCELVRDAGYACACASQNGVVWRGSDRFALPRFWIPDWDGVAFARWLKRWLGT